MSEKIQKTKLCKHCQTEISAKAKVCPNCKRSLKKSGCLIVPIVFIALIGSTAAISQLQNDSVQKSISGVSDDSEYITAEEYNKIETDMTYEQVKKIIGSDGEVSSQVEMNGVKTVIITWYGNGVAGSNANVTFMNNKVFGKAQVGLN